MYNGCKNSGANISTFVVSLGSSNDKTSGPNRRTESESALGLVGFKQYYSRNANFDYMETEAEIRELITLDYDNPNTLEAEQPENASWQTLNTAQGNAYTREVMKLKGLHGMR